MITFVFTKIRDISVKLPDDADKNLSLSVDLDQTSPIWSGFTMSSGVCLVTHYDSCNHIGFGYFSHGGQPKLRPALRTLVVLYNMSPIARKPVFGVFDHVRHKPGCRASEDS